MSAEKHKDTGSSKPNRKSGKPEDKEKLDKELDEALAASFPASDPPSLSDPSIPRRPADPDGDKR